MFAYGVRRSLAGLMLLVAMSLVTYFMFFAGGNPAQYACGNKCPPKAVAVTAKGLGYDKPIISQWADFMKGIVMGRDYPADPRIAKTHPEIVSHCSAPCLGYSKVYSENVRSLLADKVSVSFSLALVAFVIWMAFSTVFGVVAALFKGTVVDRGIVGLSLVVHSFPSFFLAIVLLDVFVNQHHVLHTPVYHPLTQGVGAWIYNLILPSLSLSLFFLAGYTRIIRAFVIETSTEDYVRTARAKGLRERRVVARHTLRAVLTPLVTISGLDLAALLGGTIITESVFSFDGLGRLAATAVTRKDLPTDVGIVLLTAAVVIVANIVVDLLYAVIDPRVRLA